MSDVVYKYEKISREKKLYCWLLSQTYTEINVLLSLVKIL